MTESLTPLANKRKASKVERVKRTSRQLRGTIARTLNDPHATCFDENDVQLIKFHGIYQQEDRDERTAAKVTGQGRQPFFMVRVKVPGGVLTPDQYLAVSKLASEFTQDGSLRLTTRQNLQLHGMLKQDLKKAICRVNAVLLDTFGGAGDVERNIMAPAAPIDDVGHRRLRKLAEELTKAMVPRTNAYHEIWLDGEKIDAASEPTDQLYGEGYLPRKFKTGLALPEDNSVEVHTQDVGLIGVVRANELIGCNVNVGGGLGMTHNNPRTYARLATPLGYVDRNRVIEFVQAVVGIHRDYGDRTDRRHARLKYIVEEFGIDAFREELEKRLGFPLEPSATVGELQHPDWLGVHNQGNGTYFLGLPISNGRIKDGHRVRIKIAVDTIVKTFRPQVSLTPDQNLIFGGIQVGDLKKIERVLQAYHVPRIDDLRKVRRHSMACPAQPTCGLALTESERVFDDVIDQLERELDRLGLTEAPIRVRMTGCPNGCVRPYTADIGLVGHKPGHYDIFLGGAPQGDRLGEHYATNVTQDELVPTLRPLLEQWRRLRMPEESFGDFWERLHRPDSRRDLLTGARDAPALVRLLVTEK